ncbi:MAG: SlyX family protein [Burkholderiaceae bacterium]
MTTHSANASTEPSRLDEVEIKLAYTEDLLETLNKQVARQAEQIEALGRELVRLKDRVDRTASVDDTGGAEAGDDKPPHY